MKKEKIILQLGVEIDTFKAHIQRLKKDGYQLHQLDIDLLQQKTRKLYDMLFELENSAVGKPIVNHPIIEKKEVVRPQPKQAPIVETKKEEPIVQTPLKTQEVIEPKAPVRVIVKEEVKVKAPIEEPKVEFIPQQKPQAEKTDIKPPVEVEKKVEQAMKVKSNFDLFSDSSSATISDKFTDTSEQSFADKMQQSPVTDLRQSIGINEKFLFINELYGGDMSRYNKAINELNEMITLKGAMTFLLEIKIENQWDETSPAYTKLKMLIERKLK